MGKRLDLLFKAVVSDQALNHLYEMRRAARPEGGVRSRRAVAVCLVLVAIAATLLVSAAWVPQDVKTYIKSRNNIAQLEAKDVAWSMTVPGAATRDVPLSEIDAFVAPAGPDSTVHLHVSFASDAFQALTGEKLALVALPRFNYHRAELKFRGVPLRQFFGGERILLTLPIEELKAAPRVEFDVAMTLVASGRNLAGSRDQTGVIVSSQGEFERFRDFFGAKQINGAGAMGDMAKVVLALFCLLLFLIIDSSSESFGLALFMGFEAAAMGIGRGWFPLGYFGIGHVPVITNYCFQMGDFLKLYFLLQMARVSGSSATRWLVIGSLLSVPYGFFMEYASINSFTWTYRIPLTRDTIVGTVGAAFCIRALWVLRKQPLPWRKAALAIAATAATYEVVNSHIAHSDLIRVYPEIRTLFTVFQSICGYLFTLSTFLNISTLENRVRNLTAAKARADEIERELAVGQIVQQALLKPPALPEVVDLTCHHEAALYVSGDTYYAHWDEGRRMLTFLVNDVTGHGVQAALKASACNVLAKTIWEKEGIVGVDIKQGSRLQEYDRMTTRLLVEMNTTPDFNSLVGAEFSPETGDLAVYRSNFTFPILIEPKIALTANMDPVLGELWTIEIVVSKNQELVQRKVRRGAFLLFMSDGFLDSSREVKVFTSYVRRELSSVGPELNCVSLTEIILKWEGFKKRKVVDDRTLLAFQWTQPNGLRSATDPDVWVPVRKIPVA